MSQTKRPEYLNENSIFVQKIELDSNICNSCYRKMREHTETMQDIATPITEYEDHAEFSYFDDFKESGRPNVHKAYCECGAVDWDDVRLRPLEQEELERAGLRIVNHLMEKGFVVDEEAFFDVVETEGPLPENQFREEEVLQKAVKKSTSKNRDDDNDDDDGESQDTIII